MKKNTWIKILSIIYVLILTWIIVFKMGFNFPYIRNINLIPFKESVIINGKVDFDEIINNCIVFIPLGIYMGMQDRKNNFLIKLFPIFGLSLGFEIIQFIFHIGASDITDVIMNTLGGAIGIGIINAIYKLFKNEEKVDKVLSILASFCTVFVVGFISLLLIANRDSVQVMEDMSSNSITDIEQADDQNADVIIENSDMQEQENIEEGDKEMPKLNIKIGEKNFTATLYDNETTRELIKQMPLTLNMSELNGNEKYYYMNQSLVANSERIGTIKKGDLMLYGSDCLVLFYESFSTSYSYTRLGYIDDPEAIEDVLGRGSVEVIFEINE